MRTKVHLRPANLLPSTTGNLSARTEVRPDDASEVRRATHRRSSAAAKIQRRRCTSGFPPAASAASPAPGCRSARSAGLRAPACGPRRVCPALKSASARSACALALSSGLAANATRNSRTASAVSPAFIASRPSVRVRGAVERIDRHDALAAPPASAPAPSSGSSSVTSSRADCDVGVAVADQRLERARGAGLVALLRRDRGNRRLRAVFARHVRNQSARPSRTPRSPHPDSIRPAPRRASSARRSCRDWSAASAFT